MAKKHTFATVAANIRKMANRRIKRLETIKASSSDAYVAQGAQKRIDSIRKQMEGTYINDRSGKRIQGRTQAERTEALTNLANDLRETQYLAQPRNMRSLKTTTSELNKASSGAASTYTTEEVKIFYRATQRAWQRKGVDIKHRNEAILEYYGRDNLADFVEEILTMNTEAVKASQTKPQEKMTKEQREMADNEADIKEAQSSPDYLNKVISAPDPSGLAEPVKA